MPAGIQWDQNEDEDEARYFHDPVYLDGWTQVAIGTVGQVLAGPPQGSQLDLYEDDHEHAPQNPDDLDWRDFPHLVGSLNPGPRQGSQLDLYEDDHDLDDPPLYDAGENEQNTLGFIIVVVPMQFGILAIEYDLDDEQVSDFEIYQWEDVAQGVFFQNPGPGAGAQIDLYEDDHDLQGTDELGHEDSQAVQFQNPGPDASDQDDGSSLPDDPEDEPDFQGFNWWLQSTIGIAYSLPITTGAYTVGGNAIGLAFGRALPISSGVYTISGNALALAHGYKIAIVAGVYTITGNALGLAFNRALPITRGLYTVTGFALLLKYGRNLGLTTGAYVVAGNALGLLYGRGMPITKGVYTIVGNAVAVTATRKLAITTGVYTVTGNAVGLARGYKVAITAGAYLFAGQPLALTAQRKLPITTGSYLVNGQPLALVYSAGPPPSTENLGIGGDTLIGKYRGDLLAEMHTLSRRTY
jgi:hypothetical protein